MLYTSYINNLESLSGNIFKLIISRYPPVLNYEKYDNLYIVKDLAPSKELLDTYLYKKKNWNWYIKEFNKEMKTRSDMINGLESLKRILLKNKDIILLCYERDYKYCHRYLIAQYFVSLGFKWSEIK